MLPELDSVYPWVSEIRTHPFSHTPVFCSLFNCVRLLFQLPHFFTWHDQRFRKYLRFLFCVSNLMHEFCNATRCSNWRPLGSSKFYVYLTHQRTWECVQVCITVSLIPIPQFQVYGTFTDCNCVIWIWFHWMLGCLAEPGKGCCSESCRPRQAKRDGRELFLCNGARTSQNVASHTEQAAGLFLRMR